MKKRRNILPAGLANKFCCSVVAAAMTLSIVSMPNVTAQAADTQKTATGVSISNPRVAVDSSYESGQKVTYDCVYFGSYPQAEVVASEADETTVYWDIRNGSDYVVDSTLYENLETATGWDANGDVTIDGEKYRRINYTNATSWDEYNECRYNWGKAEDGESVSSSYHYFKYQPIKWRVLSVDGDTAFLLADEAIDCQKYNTEYESVTWETSTIRSFLNSYGASDNQESVDYSESGFLSAAFTADEILAIKDTAVVNDDNIYYGTEGGASTTDRIFLLSENEAYGDESTAYGFVNDYSTYDEARRAKSSTYAKAMGCWSYGGSSTSYAGNCWWWLRSPGGSTTSAADVDYYGWGDSGGSSVNGNGVGVRPALKFNLSSSNLLEDAGICTTKTTSSVATDTDAPHEHVYEWRVTKEATCVSEGVESYVCVYGDEGDEYKTRAIPKDSSNHVGYTAKVTRAATCTKEGVMTYTCACGASYTKAISKTPHKNSDWTVTKKATASADGQKVVKCTTCGTVLMTEKVVKPASVSLSTSKIAYDGKVKTPAVTVRDSAGMDISASDYGVSYKNNKNPGTATVTVTFKGSTYAGTLTGKFTITKAKQTIKTAKLKTYKAKSLKTKKAVVNLKAKATGKGKLTYKVSKYPKNAKKYITVSKKGIVTLKKGAKKGTYKITITAAATGTYAKATKTVTIKVK